MTKTVKISLVGVLAVGIFSVVGMALAQTSPTASLTISGGGYSNNANITAAPGTAVTYNWTSTNAVSAQSAIQIYQGANAVASDACGNLSGSFTSAIGGLSGSLGPDTIASCEAGYTYKITYSVTSASGVTVAATPLTIIVNAPAGSSSIPTLGISSISECPTSYGECPNPSPTVSTMIGGDAYTLTVASNYDNTPITFYWQSPSGAVTNQSVGSTDASGNWTLSATSAASVTPGIWQEWVVFPSQTGSPQSNKITITILPVPASCMATGQLCTGNETSGSCRPELQQEQCIAGTKTISNGVATCQIDQQEGSGFETISATYCTGTETAGPCRPDRINQCAADRLAETWGPSCIAPKVTAPAIDPNTTLQFDINVQCTVPTQGGGTSTGTGTTSTGTTGTSTGTSLGTGTTTGTVTSGNPSTAVSSANTALNTELQTFSAQLSSILGELSTAGTSINASSISALSSQVSQISQLVSGVATSAGTGTSVITGSSGTTTGGPTVSPTATSPVSVTVGVNLLNVRSAPSVSATIVSTVSDGQTVSVTGAITGDSVSGENYWWTTSQGTYIWAGGTVQQPNPSSVASG